MKVVLLILLLSFFTLGCITDSYPIERTITLDSENPSQTFSVSSDLVRPTIVWKLDDKVINISNNSSSVITLNAAKIPYGEHMLKVVEEGDEGKTSREWLIINMYNTTSTIEVNSRWEYPTWEQQNKQAEKKNAK